MLTVIRCPACSSEGRMSLVDPVYQGPYRCWKCRALFTISIENNELKSCEPLSQEEFDRQQELKSLQDKFKRPQEED